MREKAVSSNIKLLCLAIVVAETGIPADFYTCKAKTE
jgi:hypothetical protein